MQTVSMRNFKEEELLPSVVYGAKTWKMKVLEGRELDVEKKCLRITCSGISKKSEKKNMESNKAR